MPTHHVIPTTTKPLCSFQADDGTVCQDVAVCRGMCKRHWTYCWKNALLPPKTPKEPRVLVKLYLTKPMAGTLKRLVRENGTNLSSLVRTIIDEWLAQQGVGDDVED